MNAVSHPICSICIANYNGEQVLAGCIDSVLAQEGGLPVEIIIHDDASSDGSIALLRERYPAERYPNIHLIESRENVGYCISNNRMVEVARGDYILLFNNDATLAPDALVTLLAAAQAQTPQGLLTLPQYDWETGALVDRGALLDLFYNPVPNLAPGRHDVAMIIGACLWLPRPLWHELGGFPDWFESIAEDMLLCCRARLAGYPVQATVGSHYRHYQGLSFGGNRVDGNRLATTYRRRRLSERNKTYVMVLCGHILTLPFILPLHLALLALEGLVFGLMRGDKKLWRGVYGNVFSSLIRQAGVLRRERQHIQAASRATRREYLRGFVWLPRKLQLLARHGWPSIR